MLRGGSGWWRWAGPRLASKAATITIGLRRSNARAMSSRRTGAIPGRPAAGERDRLDQRNPGWRGWSVLRAGTGIRSMDDERAGWACCRAGRRCASPWRLGQPARAHLPGSVGHPACARPVDARCVRRTGVRARYGPLVADGREPEADAGTVGGVGGSGWHCGRQAREAPRRRRRVSAGLRGPGRGMRA